MFRKKKSILNLEEGEIVEDLFAVRFTHPPKKARTGNYWFEAKLQDADGEMMLKYWGSRDEEKILEVYSKIEPECVIQAKGQVKSYKDSLELSVNEGEGNLKVLEPGEFDASDFVAKSKKEADKMFSELEHIMDGIENPEFRVVLESFFKDKNFVEKFKKSPAAMYKHHGWLNGLLEHTLAVTQICMEILKYHENLDKDLLLSGAILHDIGKIKEFEATTLIKVTDEGNLLGHVVLGVQMFSKKTENLEVSDIAKQKLLHIIVSHHGKLDYGSPKPPLFPEALLVAKADELDAFATQMIGLKEKASTTDSFTYHKDFGNIFLK